MIEKTMRCELVSWNEVYRLSRRVAKKIRDDGFRPDVVVAIARGGFIPARLLCDFLDLYRLLGLQIGHYEAGAHRIRKAELRSTLPVDVQGLNVLLVDDCSDTGDTLELALAHLRDFAPKDIRVAVLHHKQVSPITPDFYGQKVIVWRWLIYPWAVVEDLSGFLAASGPIPDSADDVIGRLHRSHGIRPSRQTAEDVLTAMGRIPEGNRRLSSRTIAGSF